MKNLFKRWIEHLKRNKKTIASIFTALSALGGSAGGVVKYVKDNATEQRHNLEDQKKIDTELRDDLRDIAEISTRENDIVDQLKDDLEAIQQLRINEAVEKEHVDNALIRNHEQDLETLQKINELEKTIDLIRGYLRHTAYE